MSTEDSGEEQYAMYKIAVIGDINVGKTSLIQRFLRTSEECDATRPTVAYDFSKVCIIEDNKRIDLQLIDCSGDPRFREVSSDVFINVKGIIFVYDVSNRESFTNLQESWLKVTDDFMEADNHCPIFVVANKVDLPNKSKVVEKKEGEHFSTAQSASCFFETSAVTGLGVEKLFRDVAKSMINTWGGLHPSMSPEAKESIQKAQKEKKKKKFKRMRRLFSACCSCRRHDAGKKSKELSTPLTVLKRQGNDGDKNEPAKLNLDQLAEEEEQNQRRSALITEEEIKIESKISKEEINSEDEKDNQDEKTPLKSEEKEEETQLHISNSSTLSDDEENQETNPLKSEVKVGTGYNPVV